MNTWTYEETFRSFSGPLFLPFHKPTLMLMVLNKCSKRIQYFNHKLSFQKYTLMCQQANRKKKKKGDNAVMILQSVSDYYDLSSRPEITGRVQDNLQFH